MPIAAHLAFAVTEIHQPTPVAAQGADGLVVPGFDLDGIVGGSLPCTSARDFFSDSDCVGFGVRRCSPARIDNQYADSLPNLSEAYYGGDYRSVTIMESAVADQIASGEWSLLLVLDGLDDGWTDDEVLVRAGRAVRAGDAFRFERAVEEASGRIEEGRIVFNLASLALPFGDRVGIHTIHDARVAARLSSTGLSAGAIGGAVPMTTVEAVVRAVLPEADFSTAEAFARPDLDPDATGLHCAAMSLGVGFTAEPADLLE